jgi:hypothetical protein
MRIPAVLCRSQRGTHAQLMAAPLPTAPGWVTYRTLAAQLEDAARAAQEDATEPAQGAANGA